jgi:hypothetical protein
VSLEIGTEAIRRKQINDRKSRTGRQFGVHKLNPIKKTEMASNSIKLL